MNFKILYAAVLLVQLIYMGLFILSKAALNQGMNMFVFVFYRQAAATILLAPLAFIFERRSAPPLSLLILFKMFMLSLLGMTIGLNLYNVGLTDTSATVASATSNSVPVLTFFLALLLRIKTFKLKSISGIAKILEMALRFSWIMTFAFYTGPHLNPLNHHHSFAHKTSLQSHSKATWIKGTLFMITSNTSWSLWLVLQRVFFQASSRYSVVSPVQSFLVALALEREISRWRLSMDLDLLAIAYCGFVVTSVSFYLQTGCIEEKGPVFLALFTPLASVFTICCSSFLLGEVISLRSVLAGIMMVGGLYGVLWGESKESAECEPTTEDRN